MLDSLNDSESPKQRAVFLGDDGKMHDIEVEALTLASMPRALPKFEEGTDEKGNFFIRGTVDIKIAPDSYKDIFKFVGIDLGKEDKSYRVDKVDDKISEEMDF